MTAPASPLTDAELIQAECSPIGIARRLAAEIRRLREEIAVIATRQNSAEKVTGKTVAVPMVLIGSALPITEQDGLPPG